MIKKPRKNRTKGIQFTFKQHYLGAQFIRKFADDSKFVEVIYKDSGDIKEKSPKDIIFCTEKCWDERTELGMKIIEDDFSLQIDKAISGSVDLDSNVINTYYWMWNIRGRLSDRKEISPKFNVEGQKELSLLEQDILEKNGYVFIKEDGTMHDDMARGLRYQIELSQILSSQKNDVKWGVLKSPRKELICCDFFDYNPFNISVSKFIVISPSLVLIENSKSGSISESDAEMINEYSMKLCRKYCIRKKVTQ